jgi:Flp pilus assembly pilin Flp
LFYFWNRSCNLADVGQITASEFGGGGQRMKIVRAMIGDRSGASSAEYALILSVVSAGLVTGAWALQRAISDSISGAANVVVVAAAGTSADSSAGSSNGTPGQSGSAPGQTGDTPGQSGNTPGQSGSTPGQSGSAPGQGGSSPGQSGDTPGQSGTTPGQSGTTPGGGKGNKKP